MRTFMRLVVAVAAILSPALARGAAAAGEEWPCWRGPRHDGISHEAIADKWPEGGPKKVWEQPVGIGFSSPIGFDGKVYLFFTAAEKEVLTCFDAGSGAPLWSQGYEMRQHVDYPGARATPAIDDGHIYTYGAGGDLTCRELAGGKQAWQVNVLQETHSQPLGAPGQVWAQASSPLVDGDLVYVQGGKESGPVALALDKKTGKIAWLSEAKGLGGYAAPVLGEVKGAGRQLFILGGDAVYGMEPATGKTIWTEPWKTNYDVNATTPIFDGEHLFITSGYLHGCTMLQVTKDGAKKMWANKLVQARFQAGALDGQFLYAPSDDKHGVFKCLSWPDGAVKWVCEPEDMKIGFGGSIVRDGDKLVTMSQTGVLSLVKATPEAWEKVGQVKLFTPAADQPDIWSTPLIYRGKLYAKGETQLVCLEIGK